jgi:hypothetical protein
VEKNEGMKRDWTGVAMFLGVVVAVSLLLKTCMDKAAEAPRVARQEIMATARDASAWIKEVFGIIPEVRVREVVVHGQSAPVAELAVIEKTFPLTYQWKQTWMGSTKTLTVEGMWRAKAGFDLFKPFQVSIDPETRQVSADLPPAEILSVELESGPELKGESGWWNRLSDEDRSAVVAEFSRRARAQAQESGLTAEAEAEAARRLQTLADRNQGRGGYEFRFRSRKSP